jgi:hypothetical protein
MCSSWTEEMPGNWTDKRLDLAVDVYVKKTYFFEIPLDHFHVHTVWCGLEKDGTTMFD